MNDSLIDQIEIRAEGLKLMLNAVLAPLVIQRDYAALQGILNGVASVKELEYIQVVDLQSKPIAWAGITPSSFPADRKWNHTQGEHIFYQEYPLSLAGESVGHVRVGISTHTMEQANVGALWQGISIALMGLAAMVIILIPVSGFLTHHLEALAQGRAKNCCG